MRLNEKYNIRKVAGENILLITAPGGKDGEANLTKVISLNETAAFLWSSFYGVDFTREEAVAKLLEEYDVTEEVAGPDVDKWIETLASFSLIV